MKKCWRLYDLEREPLTWKFFSERDWSESLDRCWLHFKFKGGEDRNCVLTFGFIRHTHPQTCEGNVPTPLDLVVSRSGHYLTQYLCTSLHWNLLSRIKAQWHLTGVIFVAQSRTQRIGPLKMKQWTELYKVQKVQIKISSPQWSERKDQDQFQTYLKLIFPSSSQWSDVNLSSWPDRGWYSAPY